MAKSYADTIQTDPTRPVTMSYVDYVRKLQRDLASPAARKARQERKSAKLARLAGLSDAVADASEGFINRNSHLWMKNEDGATKKLSGHPGAAACAYVSETFGEFNINGALKTVYAGLHRSAGSGGHDITDGTIAVQVEMTPVKGMTQRIEVPVTVKNGYMLSPGIFYHQGSPYIISQSAIDELVSDATFRDEVRPDRKNMFSPPRTSSAVGGGAGLGSGGHSGLRGVVPRTAELTVEITVPDTRQVIPCGAQVTVLAEHADGLHVLSDNGVEALVSKVYLR